MRQMPTNTDTCHINQMALFVPLPQDALRDPAKWNTAWEVFLSVLEGPLVDGPSHCFQLMLRRIRGSGDLDFWLSNYAAFVSNTCAIQCRITDEALRYFTRDNFEAKWMTAGADVRGKHILDAMAAVCSKAQNLNEARAYCPELRLARLRLDGKIFLGLLRSVMLEDASFIPSQPIFVSHPRWDAWAAGQRKSNNTAAEKVALGNILILRTKLICECPCLVF